MKILITGASGQLGSSLVQLLKEKHEIVACSKRELDVSDRDAVYAVIRAHQPEVIIHTAAFTHVDHAETHVETAFQINAFGTRFVAEAAQQVGAKMVHISTDYVFDGKKGKPYQENDVPSPMNLYGSTKLLSEKFCSLYCSRSFVVRTAWLYGSAKQGFIHSIHQQTQQRSELFIVSDCIGSPTYVVDLAEFLGQLIKSDHYGIYHAVNDGYCSRYEWAEAICEELGIIRVRLVPVLSEHYPQAALRPANTSLSCESMRIHGFKPMRHWRQALHEYLSNINHSK